MSRGSEPVADRRCPYCQKLYEDFELKDHIATAHADEIATARGKSGARAAAPAPEQNRLPTPLRGPLNMGCLLLLVIIGGAFFLNSTSKPSSTTTASTPATAAPTPAAHIGTYVVDSGWRISLRQSDVASTVSVNDGGYVTNYPAKGIYVILLVELTNQTSNGSGTLNLGAFALRDARGTVYAPTRITRLYARETGYSELGQAFPPNVPLLVNVYFDVAPATNGFVLLVAPGGPFPTTQIAVE